MRAATWARGDRHVVIKLPCVECDISDFLCLQLSHSVAEKSCLCGNKTEKRLCSCDDETNELRMLTMHWKNGDAEHIVYNSLIGQI